MVKFNLKKYKSLPVTEQIRYIVQHKGIDGVVPNQFLNQFFHDADSFSFNNAMDFTNIMNGKYLLHALNRWIHVPLLYQYATTYPYSFMTNKERMQIVDKRKNKVLKLRHSYGYIDLHQYYVLDLTHMYLKKATDSQKLILLAKFNELIEIVLKSDIGSSLLSKL